MDLKKFYLDSKFPGSYSGAYKFYQEVKNIHPKVTLKKVNEFLKSQDAYTLHKRTRKPKFRRTLVFKPRDLWQIDLLDMQKYSKENEEAKEEYFHSFLSQKINYYYIFAIVFLTVLLVDAKPRTFRLVKDLFSRMNESEYEVMQLKQSTV